MPNFNLTFRGEIIAGRDPARVRRRFGELFFIDDPARLERFFDGSPVTLRRNLDRDRASELFLTLREIGLKVELERCDEANDQAPPVVRPKPKTIDSQRRAPGRVDQRWATGNIARPKKAEAPVKVTQQAAQEQTIKLLHQLREARDASRGLSGQSTAPKPAPNRRRAVPPKARFKVRKSGRKRQRPGQPNLFQLNPFRNTANHRRRAEESTQSVKLATTAAILAVLALLMTGIRYATLPQPPVLEGPYAAATSASGHLLLVINGALLLHDRSGTGAERLPAADLGLGSVLAPLLFTDDDTLLLRGSLLTQSGAAGPEGFLRCRLSDRQCSPFSDELEPGPDIAIGVHPRTGSIFLADAHADKLYKFGPDGQLYADVSAEIPPSPRMLWWSGLLFVSSANGPAISVYRPDDGSFGQQLDELLLLPPTAVNNNQTVVSDFTRAGKHWWATLSNPDSGDSGVYRFGDKWNFISNLAFPPGFNPQQLLGWRDKLLVRDSAQLDLQRFNGRGQAELPVSSDLLSGLAESQRSQAETTEYRWRLGMIILTSMALTAWLIAQLYKIRSRIYEAWPTRSAEPLKDEARAVKWIQPASQRLNRLQQLALTYCFLCVTVLAVATVWGASTVQWSALLATLAGPALGLFTLYRNRPGHLGLKSRELVLVDQRDTLHRGVGPRIHYRGGFVLIDDVVLYTGNRLLPVFNREQLRKYAAPIISSGVKVERRTLWIRALENRNSFALALLFVPLGVAVGGIILALG